MSDWPSGLTRFDNVLSAAEQAELVAFAERMLLRGREGSLAGKSYLPVPEEWRLRGQGRETVQFGVLVKCNKVLHARVEPVLPPLAAVSARLVERGILTADQTPECVCLNVYERGSWLPAHVDSAAFDRPFCTLSLLAPHVAVFGPGLASAEPCTPGGAPATAKHGLAPSSLVEMPVGSVLRVDGYSAGPECKHELPPHPARRISLTFRRLSAETKRAHRAAVMEVEAAAVRRRERRHAAAVAKRSGRRRGGGGESPGLGAEGGEWGDEGVPIAGWLNDA
jgi:hypothetical protein